jgi:hypothetical protein
LHKNFLELINMQNLSTLALRSGCLFNYRRFSTTSSFAQAGLTSQQSAVVHGSATVSFDVTLLSNSNNNELLFINLATVPADVILLSRLRKAVPVSGQATTTTN